MPIPRRLCSTICQKQPLCADCISDLPLLLSACPRCAMPMKIENLCGHCLTAPPVQQRSFSLYLYQKPVTNLIIDLKFNNKLYFNDFFARQMTLSLKNKTQAQLLIPIPLHPDRLRQRGYNQSLELAKSLSSQLSIPVSNDCLRRITNTKPQSSIAFKERKSNVKNAFALTSTQIPDHIALIDDVLTTGHTVNEAAKLFRRAGTKIIEVWTIARAIRHDWHHE